MQAEEDHVRHRARQLAAEAAATGDETGWFEKLYREAEDGTSVVPWTDGVPNPHLVQWLADRDGAGQRALVVGCGLGYDAEFLAGRGFEVTAFDAAPTAIVAAIRANPGSAVDYVTADLVDLPAAWTGAFDLVVEIYTVQPLYGPVRARALAALHQPVAPGGTLLVIARAIEEEDPERDPAMMPWPLTRAELMAAGGPLRLHQIDQVSEPDLPPPGFRWRAEFRRPRP